MPKSIYILLWFVLISVGAIGQISRNLYLPSEDLADSLKVDSIYSLGTWYKYTNKKKKSRPKLREGHKDIFVYDVHGNLVQMIEYLSHDSDSIFTLWKYKYNLEGKLIETSKSELFNSDSVADLEIITYSREAQFINVKKESVRDRNGEYRNVYFKNSFQTYKDEILIRDSIISKYDTFPSRIKVIDYEYNSSGYLAKESKVFYRNGEKDSAIYNYKYDSEGFILSITKTTKHKTKQTETWKYDEDSNYVEHIDHSKKSKETFRYNDQGWLIEYCPDRNKDILRVYEFTYYPNGLIETWTTIAPKDDWKSVNRISYSYRDS